MHIHTCIHREPGTHGSSSGGGGDGGDREYTATVFYLLGRVYRRRSREHTPDALDVRMKLCSAARATAHAQISPRGGSVWPSPKLVLPFRVPTRLVRISLRTPSPPPPRDQYRRYTAWCYASSPDIAYSHRYCGFGPPTGNIQLICRKPAAESRFPSLFLFFPRDTRDLLADIIQFSITCTRR